MSTDLVPVPVPGADDLMAAQFDGREWASLRHMCDSLGIDYVTQLRKLKGRSWATVGQKPMVAADGKVREMALVVAGTSGSGLEWQGAFLHGAAVKVRQASRGQARHVQARQVLTRQAGMDTTGEVRHVRSGTGEVGRGRRGGVRTRSGGSRPGGACQGVAHPPKRLRSGAENTGPEARNTTNNTKDN